MTPEEQDARNFWVRLADNWYGSASTAQDGWNADIPSIYAGLPGARPETEAVGYYRLDTGNPTRDAIFSVLLNQLGVDNAMRATQSRLEGDMGWNNYWREILGGVAEVALIGKSTAGAVGGRVIARGLPAALNTLRRAPVTSVRGGTPVYERVVRQLGGELGAVRDLARAYTPITINTARTGPRPITQLRPGNVVDAIGDVATRFGNAGWAGLRNRLSPSRLPGGRVGAALSLLGGATYLISGRPGSEVRQTATEVADAQQEAASSTDENRSVPRDIVPVGDPVANAGDAARNDAAAIQRQYGNILRELQNMYQLSETEEERERLRFMLADIEAQRDAGLQAISDGYRQTVGAIQARAVTSRERTSQMAQQFGFDLEGYADRAAQRMMLQNAQMQQSARGLGAGSASPVNEWVGLMSTMAPAQQRYTQTMGDITAEGIDWLGDTVSAQGQAQQADLQRLAAATRSAGIMSHQRQVADRINREREQQRAAILSVMQQQVGALGSVDTGVNVLDRNRFIREHPNYLPGQMNQVFRNMGMHDLTPGELAQVQIENRNYYGQDAMDAANTPVGD